MKIRTRLVLWYFFTSLILLLIFSLGTYLGMRHLLLNSLDAELIEKKDEIAGSYNSVTDSFAVLNHPYFIQTELSNFYLILYNNSDQVLLKSKIVELANINLPTIKSDTSYTTTAIINKKSTRINDRIIEAKFRIMGNRILNNGNVVGYLVIGQSFEKLYEAMDKLLIALLFGVGLAILIIISLSYFLTNRSLQPIDNLVGQAQQISYQNLSERLDVQNPADEIGRLTNVLNDLLRRLQEAFNKEQEFMADAAHELKTPLTVLRTHWEDELNNKEIPDTFKEKLVKDIETITRLSKLINNLLLLSNSEYFQLRSDFEKIDLALLINEVISNTKILAELKNQTINILELSHVFIMGDKTKLYQLYFNLIDNALKYTPENGSIYISVREDQKNSVVEIKDNGIGIPANDIPHIFRRFYRVHKDRSKKMGGNGLGLAIAKFITEIHKGEISVRSHVGEGSTFIVKLPIAT